MKLPSFRIGVAAQLLALALLVNVPEAMSKRYLFVSSTSGGGIYYARLLNAAEQATGQRMELQTLTTVGQVTQPMGMAVDNVRRVLYVADPAASAVLGLRISVAQTSTGEELSVEPPRPVAQQVNAHGVAVDSLGTLFFTDTGNHKIFSIPASVVETRLDGAGFSSADDTLLYSGENLTSVKSPQGIAVDNFNIFWANSDTGDANGALVKGREVPSPAHDRGATVVKLDDTGGRVASAVCLSSSRVVYTDTAARVYSIRMSGGTVTEITDRLVNPRGCVYDGDGTVFVTDKEAPQPGPATDPVTLGAVYSFSGGSSTRLAARPLRPELYVQDAHGLAMFESVARRGGAHRLALLAFAATAWVRAWRL